MRIGLFTDCYYPQINGVVTSVMTLRDELISRGHEVTVITVQVQGYESSSEGFIRIKAAPKMQIMDFRMAIPLFYRDYLRIKALDLDLIHTHTEFTIGLFGRFLARRLRIPMVHTYHTMYEDYTNYILRFRRGRGVVKHFMRDSSRRFVSRYDMIVVPSLKTEKALRSYQVRNDIAILPTGIDLDKFPRYAKTDPHLAEMREVLGLSESTKVVLSLGRVSEEKSVDMITSQMTMLAKQVGDVRLLVVGDGPYKDFLEKQSKNMKMDSLVRFVGRVPWNEVPYYYSLADVFVSASKTETQGLTILEAMACQVPVVVFDDDNVAGIVMEGDSGRLFTDRNSLTKCLTEVLTDLSHAKVLAARGREVAESLSRQQFGEKAEKLYVSLLKDYEGGRNRQNKRLSSITENC